MNSTQLIELAEKIEECQLDLIRAAGREQCEDRSRMEAHIFKALSEAHGYTELLRQAADRAQPASICELRGRLAA